MTILLRNLLKWKGGTMPLTSCYPGKNIFGRGGSKSVLLQPPRGSSAFSLTSGRHRTGPVLQKPEDAAILIEDLVKSNPVFIFSKTTCPFCNEVKGLFNNLQTDFGSLELDTMKTYDATLIQHGLREKTGQFTVPNVFIRGRHIGGCDDTFRLYQEDKLIPLIRGDRRSSLNTSHTSSHNYDYDMIVIGGGSGGLAAAKETAKLGKKVALLDFVKPSPQGSTWGIGGTCVNVGCIPKKLMHQAALIGQAFNDAPSFGWQFSGQKNHDWSSMVVAIQEYIKSLNWGYRVSLRDAGVTYLNEFGAFLDANTIQATNKKGQTRQITAQHFLIAVGGRPKYPDFPGAKEFAVTSDDVFAIPHNPGKTLCIGASYIALETAGFLAGLGIETTVMVRSVLLREFDQQMAGFIGESMEEHGVRFLKGWVPTSIRKVSDGSPPELMVTAKQSNGSGTWSEKFNTVVLAVGRTPCTADLNLDKIGLKVNPTTAKVITDPSDQSNISNIYAVGDVSQNMAELTPIAILAGRLLARRLYGGRVALTDYDKVPTTVFTPMEYSCTGLSEEKAIEKYGADNIEVYHSHFQALEHALPKRDLNKCYVKLICVKSEKNRVVGLHYLGPNAGEVMQGYGMGLKFGATKDDFDELIGIHPTTARNFTELEVTKSSGLDPKKKGCCG